jgi:transposase
MDSKKMGCGSKRYDRQVATHSGRRRQRRSWQASEKSQILAESFYPGANVSEVARRHGLHTNILFRWRREALNACQSSKSPTFVPVTLATAVATSCSVEPARHETPEDEAPEDTSGARSGLIEIELAGALVRLRGRIGEAHLRAVLAAVRGTA